MATLTCHALDAIFGRHAAHLPVSLTRITANEQRIPVFASATSAEGRLQVNVHLDRDADPGSTCELRFGIRTYLDRHPAELTAHAVLSDLILRFELSDPNGRYHFPLSITPSSCSVLAVVQPV